MGSGPGGPAGIWTNRLHFDRGQAARRRSAVFVTDPQDLPKDRQHHPVFVAIGLFFFRDQILEIEDANHHFIDLELRRPLDQRVVTAPTPECLQVVHYPGVARFPYAVARIGWRTLQAVRTATANEANGANAPHGSVEPPVIAARLPRTLLHFGTAYGVRTTWAILCRQELMSRAGPIRACRRPGGSRRSQVLRIARFNLRIDRACCCAIANRSVGVLRSIQRIRVKSTPSSL